MKSCTPGNFCPGDGTQYLCPSGTFSETAEAYSCFPCPPGQISGSGAVVCEVCGAGNYASGNATACEPCPLNSYCAEGQTFDCPNTTAIGASNCFKGKLVLSLGVYANTITNSLEDCPAGYYCDGDLEKRPCESGKFQPDVGQSMCLKCEVGFFASENASSACTPCEPGTTTTTANRTSADDCTPVLPTAGGGDEILVNALVGVSLLPPPFLPSFLPPIPSIQSVLPFLARFLRLLPSFTASVIYFLPSSLPSF